MPLNVMLEAALAIAAGSVFVGAWGVILLATVRLIEMRGIRQGRHPLVGALAPYQEGYRAPVRAPVTRRSRRWLTRWLRGKGKTT